MIKDVLSFRWSFTVNLQMFYELVFLILAITLLHLMFIVIYWVDSLMIMGC